MNLLILQAMSLFTNGLGDQGSIPGQVITKTQKMVLDASLLNTQPYKVRIKGKMEQSKERSIKTPLQGIQSAYLKPCQQSMKEKH